MLSQYNDEGCDHFIAYFSRKLLPLEKNYPAVEKESRVIKLEMDYLKYTYWENHLMFRLTIGAQVFIF